MSRFANRDAILVLVLSLLGSLGLARPAIAAKPAPDQVMRTEHAAVAGEIVDCASYLLAGLRGPDHRATQEASIDNGAPACLVADNDGQVYLLLSPGGQAREKFQPTMNFLGGGTVVTGSLFERGALKTLVVEKVDTAGSPSALKDARHPGTDSMVKPKKKPTHTGEIPPGKDGGQP